MSEKERFIWANLLILSPNMWHPKDFKDYVDWDPKVWDELTVRSRDVGFNTIVIDLGDGIVFPSHPELAIKGSWTPEETVRQLTRLRKMGLEPIPKLNFSATHDLWLKQYERMVSSPTYYRVCADIIRDVCEIFGSPRFFHLGLDEENAGNQARFDYGVIRQGKLWWHDVRFLANEVARNGARAWVWADPAWNMDDYCAEMPKDVIQNNWYYWTDIPAIEKAGCRAPAKEDGKIPNAHYRWMRTFLDLEKAGFDQIPAATTFYHTESMDMVLDFCRRNVSPERLKGFFLMDWRATTPQPHRRHEILLEEAERLIKKYS